MNWYAVENEIRYRKMDLERTLQQRTKGRGIESSQNKRQKALRDLLTGIGKKFIIFRRKELSLTLHSSK